MVAITIISILLTFSNAEQQPYSTFPIHNGAGIFYNEIGKAKITSDYFTLLSFTNITLYEHSLNFIQRMFTKTNGYCLHPVKDVPTSFFLCRNRLEILQNRINNLEEKFDSIRHMTGHNIKDLRVRRGLFNAVSTAMKFLIGTPDADDASYYDESIHTVLQQNHDVKMLMKQQIHVISNAISEYNKTVLTLQVNEEKLNKNFEIFNVFANKTISKINSLSYYQLLTVHINLLSFIINETDDDFSLLIATILFAKQNVLHPSIITPSHLRDELSQIKLHGLTEFPFSLEHTDEIHKYLMITELSVIYYQGTLIFAIKIPLVLKELYQLFHLIPLPLQLVHQPVYSYIDPSFPYLTLSESRTYYGQMEDLMSCKKLPPDEYICYNVIVHLTKERPICETTLRLNPQLLEIPPDCQTRTIKSTMEVWHSIQNNQWLYILTQATPITLNCGKSQIFDAVIQGTGIFNLNPGCRCYTTSTLLAATTNLIANHTHYFPTPSITEDDCCVEKQRLLSTETMKPMQLHNLNLNELRHAQHKLDQYDQLIQSSINQPFLNVHHSWYTILLACAVIFALLILFCFTCCNRCCPCRWIFDIIRRRWSSSQKCGMSVCINSHNVSHSSGDVYLHELRHLDNAHNTDRSRMHMLSGSTFSLPTDVQSYGIHSKRTRKEFRL